MAVIQQITAAQAAGASIPPWNDVTYTIGTESANAITVKCEVLGYSAALALPIVFDAYISEASDGEGLTGTALSGDWADGGDGNLHYQIVTGKAARWQTNDSGSCQITMTHSGARNIYLVILLPTGLLSVSDVIAFT
jgi:hypothetical protein